MQPSMVDVLIVLQWFVVLFVALHDWVQLGRLNDLAAVHATDPPRKLLLVTVLSTLPFAFGAVASVRHAGALPGWLLWYLWICYGAAAYGMLRAWWVPYLLIPDPARAARYQARFGRTLGFLPARNGIRPDTLHVTLHVVIVAILVLLGALSSPMWARG